MCTPRTQMTHNLEDLTHKMEGQPPPKTGQWGSRILGMYNPVGYQPPWSTLNYDNFPFLSGKNGKTW